MTKITRLSSSLFRTFFFLVLSCLWLSPVPSSFANDKILHFTTGEKPPYVSKKIKNKGFAAQIVREAYALMGYTVQFDFYPWKRSMELAKKDTYDGTFPWTIHDERAKYFLYSDPFVTSPIYFFHHKNTTFDWNSIRDLKNYRVGTTHGYSYTHNFRKQAKDAGIQLLDSDSDIVNLKLLANNRIDIFPINLYVGKDLVNNQLSPSERQNLTFHKKPLQLTELSILFSKDKHRSKELADLFNEGLGKLKASGRFQQIVTQHSDAHNISAAITHRPPWVIVDNDNLAGIDVEILKRIAEKLDLSIHFTQCPWARCVEMTKNGTTDIIASFSKTEERESFFSYSSTPYHKEQIAFFKKAGTPIKIATYDDLRGYTIGTAKGAVYFDRFDNDKDLVKVTVAHQTQLLKMLLFDRIDVLISDETNHNMSIIKEGLEGEFEQTSYTVPAGNAYIAFSKKSDALVLKPLVDMVLEEMISNGEIQEIIEKYSSW